MSRLIWLPLALFAIIAAVVLFALVRPRDEAVRSAMVGRALPAFRLAPIASGKPGLDDATFRSGQPRLLNVFASWCVPCAAEAPQLLRLKAAGVPIDAVAVRDTPADIAEFLNRYGDPYERIGDDPRSAIQIALGSSGVPESFVIDGRGRIVLQHIGPINAAEVDDILNAVRRAR